MHYITADPHGDWRFIRRFARKRGLTAADTIIVLGDAGVNYYFNHRDEEPRRDIAKIDATVFCIHGNHEARPETLPALYHEEQWRGGTVYVEDALPHLKFARDGEIFDFAGLSVLVMGGAYSIDKLHRLERGWSWFADEQPSAESKARAAKNLEARGWRVDVVLSHTCPHAFEPLEAYLEGVDQSRVDKTTELFLDELERKLDYRRWYCGHWHISKQVERLRFVYHEIEPFPTDAETLAARAGSSREAASRVLYTADLHLGHANIIRFCNRPFADVDEMNQALIANWNARVRPSDEVYVVGDFMYRSSLSAKTALEELAGKKHLVIGNHDARWMKSLNLDDFFESVNEIKTIDDAGRQVVMCHYPMMAWPGKRSFHVYGHIHNNTNDSYWPLLSSFDKALNAGVEVNGYAPATLDELIKNNRTWQEGLITLEGDANTKSARHG